MSGIHQFVPMLHRRDAVGEHTRSLRDRLVAAGIISRIYTELPDPETVAETRPYLSYEADAEPGDLLVYQVATCSALAGWLADRPEPLVLNYHSITPPDFFARWNNAIARLQVGAIAELSRLAPRAALGIGVSSFDAEELRRAGCTRTVVIPVAGVAVPPVTPDRATLERLSDRRDGDGPQWLSVGRLAPNKDHQETIAALFVARATCAPRAQLTLVGSPTEPSYAAALHRYADSLGLDGAVTFEDGLSDSELSAHYEAADVLVMLSDHEGFAVPLLEAMAHGLPVVAFAAGAVPEVLGGAGVLLEEKGPRHVAGAVTQVTGDPGRRDSLASTGRDRVAAFGLERAGSDLVEALQAVQRGDASGR